MKKMKKMKKMINYGIISQKEKGSVFYMCGIVGYIGNNDVKNIFVK